MIPAEYLNQIVTGDARVLAERLPDESVDLIFTDPVYSERPLYDWLGQVARRVLKPTGAVLCWSNGKWHHENTNWLEATGLTYRYDFGCVIMTGMAPMNGKIISKINRLVWMDGDGSSKMIGYLADGFSSFQWSQINSEWHWTKNPRFMAAALNAFASAGSVVFDPFAGEGGIVAVSKAQGRSFVAFEIDPATAERARERVANTQAMHPVFLEEQEALPW
jgi:hypothetical protein